MEKKRKYVIHQILIIERVIITNIICLLLMFLGCQKKADAESGCEKSSVIVKMNVIVEDGKKYLLISDISNWMVIFQNNNNLHIDECYDGLEFYKFIYKNVNVLINTSLLYENSFKPTLTKLEIIDKNIESTIKEKLFLEKNKEYYLFSLPWIHTGPVFRFYYDGQNVKLMPWE
jgi:hypothetical protein